MSAGPMCTGETAATGQTICVKLGSEAGLQPGQDLFAVLQNPQRQDEGKNLVAVLQIAVDELGALVDPVADGVPVDE